MVRGSAEGTLPARLAPQQGGLHWLDGPQQPPTQAATATRLPAAQPALPGNAPEEVHPPPRLRQQLLHNVHGHGADVQVRGNALPAQQVVLPVGSGTAGGQGAIHEVRGHGRGAGRTARPARHAATQPQLAPHARQVPAPPCTCALDAAVLVQLNVLDPRLHPHLAAARCWQVGQEGAKARRGSAISRRGQMTGRHSNDSQHACPCSVCQASMLPPTPPQPPAPTSTPVMYSTMGWHSRSGGAPSRNAILLPCLSCRQQRHRQPGLGNATDCSPAAPSPPAG